MSGLRRLDLRGNLLRGLPASFAGLTELEHLNLDRTAHRATGAALALAFRELHLDGNAQRALPVAIRRLRGLRVRSLFGKKMQSVPATLPELGMLEELSVGNNALTKLPNTLWDPRRGQRPGSGPGHK